MIRRPPRFPRTDTLCPGTTLFRSSGGIGWDISLYRSEIRNELQCLTLFPWAPCTTTNADRTVHQGIEVGLDATIPLSALGDSLALTAAYTYSDFFFDDDAIYGDNRIPGVPKHYLRAELLYKHPGGFYAEIGRAHV